MPRRLLMCVIHEPLYQGAAVLTVAILITGIIIAWKTRRRAPSG